MAKGVLKLLMIAAFVGGISAPAVACDDDGGEYTSWVSLLPSAPLIAASTVAAPDVQDG